MVSHEKWAHNPEAFENLKGFGQYATAFEHNNSEFETTPDEVSNTAPVQVSPDEVRELLKTDREFFIQYFMAELITVPIPQFHIDSFDLMVRRDVRKLALALPRGHSKTTLAKLAVVHYFLFSDYKFIVYVSNTAEIAQAACRDIIDFLRSPNCVAVFGQPDFSNAVGGMERRGEGFFAFQLNGKKCILRALGAGQQVRGINVENTRPELGVVDDLEDDDNTETDTLQLKLKKWVYGPFFKCFNRWKMKIIWLGNMISNKCMLKEHCESINWHSWRLGALLSDGSPLWPDLWPLEALKADYVEYARQGMISKWMAEMMNAPIPDGGGIIKPEEIYYRPVVFPGAFKYGFITIDPAISLKAAADPSAIAVHGLVGDCWQIVDYIRMRLDPIQLINVALSMSQKWGIRVIGIEAVSFQASLEYFFKYIMAERQEHNIEILPLMAGEKKAQRILPWAGLMKNKSYAINEGEFAITEELLTYDPTKRNNNDNLLDACSYGIQMQEQFMGVIMSLSLMAPEGSITTSFATSGV